MLTKPALRVVASRQKRQRIALLALSAFALCGPPAAIAAEHLPSSVRLSPEVALQGRHPEVIANPAFLSWRQTHEVGGWHETVCLRNRRQVIVQAISVDQLFAVAAEGCELALRERVTRAQAIDATHTVDAKANALRGFSAIKDAFDSQRLRAVRPVIEFLPGGGARLSWQVEFDTTTHRRQIEFRGDKQWKSTKFSLPKHVPALLMPSGLSRALGSDDLAGNELHHLDEFRAEATEWTEGATTVHEKAQRIYDAVRRKYRYDSHILMIDNFTWADHLTRDINNYAGICDEWAVVQISYLRSLGIPARLIFLAWLRGTVPQAHAALEFQDQHLQWHQMDALFGFDDPSVYGGRYAVSHVTVMDAGNPDDARSTVPVNGEADLAGDGKLSPYDDIEIWPAYPGQSRPGYSK